jgi:hypothetical protein
MISQLFWVGALCPFVTQARMSTLSPALPSLGELSRSLVLLCLFDCPEFVGWAASPSAFGTSESVKSVFVSGRQCRGSASDQDFEFGEE